MACRTPQDLLPCWVISHGRGFLHDYFIIVLCVHHFVTCQARLWIKHVHLKHYSLDLAERWQIWGEKKKKWETIPFSQEVWILPSSSLKVTVDHEPCNSTTPAEHLSLAIQLHYGSYFLLPPRVTLYCTFIATHEGKEPS